MQRPTKQSMGELKLRRLLEHNQRLRDDLTRPRINVSEAASRYAHSRTTYAHELIPLSSAIRQFDSPLQDDKRPSRALLLLLCPIIGAPFSSPTAPA